MRCEIVWSVCVLSVLATGTPVVPLKRVHRSALLKGSRFPQSGSITKDGEYYVTVQIGGKPFDVQLDTGSSDLAVPAIGCPSKDPYDPSVSSSAVPILCEGPEAKAYDVMCPLCHGKVCAYENKYADGSAVSAAIYNETVSFGPGMETKTVVGAIYSTSKDFQSDANAGILGFASRSMSATDSQTVLQNLVYSGVVKDFAFAVCYNTVGGALWLGLPDASLLSSVRWTPLLEGSMYPVKVLDLQVGGKGLGISADVYRSGHGCIVDTGSTDLAVPHGAFEALRARFLQLCNTTAVPGVCGVSPGKTIFDNVCFDFSTEDLAKFPPVSVLLDGVTATLTGADYFNKDCGGKEYSLNIQDIGDDESGMILGDTFLKKFLTVVDVSNDRVGFGPIEETTCAGAMLQSTAFASSVQSIVV